MNASDTLTIDVIRQRLATAEGPQYWRGLEELADTEEFREFLHREFPREASVFEDAFNRRKFLQVMGASLALAGLSSCTKQPDEKIIPYITSPEYLLPGKPVAYATAMVVGGYATGVLATSHMGRPTKIEGNPDHPSSLGASDVFTQASILTLYDPDRSQVVTHKGEISTTQKFTEAMQREMEVQLALQGEGLRILTEPTTSPTLARQMAELSRRFPKARWHQYEPIGTDAVRQGAEMAFGENVQTHYLFEKADIVLSLDGDFLGCGPMSVRYSRDFSARRRIDAEKMEMNRLYVVESVPTITGTMADHRLSLRGSDIEVIARVVAGRLGVIPNDAPEFAQDKKHSTWVDAVVRDLQRNKGRSIVLAGMNQPPAVHALAHLVNHALGNNGATVRYTESPIVLPLETASLQTLVNDIDAGGVDLLLICGGNPVFDAPVELDFGKKLAQVQTTVRLGLYHDETSEQCHWHVAESHYLETWSDARAFDGTVTIMQPLIAPLYNSKSIHELIELMNGTPSKSSHDIVAETWRKEGGNFDQFWHSSLNDGIVRNTAFPDKVVAIRPFPREPRFDRPRGLELQFRPDPSIWDGRFANNGWLQELPKPITKLTWDNAALLSPRTAEALKLKNKEVIELRVQGRTLKVPVCILPGHAEDAVTLHLGYGRTRAGKVGTGTGYNAYALRSGSASWNAAGLEIRKTGEKATLAFTQLHHSMEGRALVRDGTLEEYKKNPSFAQEMGHKVDPERNLYPPYTYDGHAWGMSIDLNACTGCNACVIACQSENNIPIVGKEQVDVGREMHWIRVDNYFKGNLDEPEIVSQPVACMHCESAPCEVVCPVAATTHDSEGLNVMTYNRCVGTRYCANNCPYKVRRFNFLQYSDLETESYKLMRNPDVTVRNRGVMEKCTYCVQRISAARINAKKEMRSIADGEVVTACQSACPAQAIVFGDINDANSKVVQMKSDPRNYSLLGELNTQPRTTYLAKLKNPNSDIDIIG